MTYVKTFLSISVVVLLVSASFPTTLLANDFLCAENGDQIIENQKIKGNLIALGGGKCEVRGSTIKGDVKLFDGANVVLTQCVGCANGEDKPTVVKGNVQTEAQTYGLTMRGARVLGDVQLKFKDESAKFMELDTLGPVPGEGDSGGAFTVGSRMNQEEEDSPF